ncbi:MAG TPA: hypothetical protein VK131_09100 [Candidatus Acidoferrales bacterium]|nr:hypothetical protein [Candidatus Acidoferrales bacterium]
MTDAELDLLEYCPVCGRPREEWTENQGEGYPTAELIYCSRECAARDQARGHTIV